MFKSYLRIFFRHIRKSPFFFLINITSLIIGTATFLYIFLYVNYEFSYDDFWPDHEHIYRVSLTNMYKGEPMEEYANNTFQMFYQIQKRFPEVKASGFIGGTSIVSNGIEYYENGALRKKIFTDKIQNSSQHFFEVFPLKMLFQKTDTLLNKLDQVIISAKIASQLFGKNWQDSTKRLTNLNLTMVFYNGRRYPVDVIGVFEDFPANSHFDFEVLTFNPSVVNKKMVYWNYPLAGGVRFHTYIKLDKKTKPDDFAFRLNEWFSKVQAREKLEFYESGYHMHQVVTPLEHIHLEPEKMNDFKPKGNKLLVHFLLISGIIILIISWINYINLSVSNSIKYAHEVGLRKTVGANKIQLILQFFFEAALFNLLALVLAIILLEIMMPVLNQQFNKPLSSTIFWEGLPNGSLFIALLLGVYIINLIFSGLYPVFILSSYQPVTILKAKSNIESRFLGKKLEKNLVILQFMVSIVLITSTLTIIRQINFLQQQEKGFNPDNILIIENRFERDSVFNNNLAYFKNECSRLSMVKSVTSSSTIPGNYNLSWNYKRPEADQFTSFRLISIDHDFFRNYGIPLMEGRPFSENYDADRFKMIINETALKKLGFKNPESSIGKIVVDNVNKNNQFEIIGVVKDYHHCTVAEIIEPTLFILSGGYWFGGDDMKRTNTRYGIDRKFITVRFNQEINVKHEYVSEIKNIWDASFNMLPFNYYFLSDKYDEQYNGDEKIEFATASFSVIVVIIACLGLLGLAVNTLNNKVKEIAIRKVLGASFSNLVILLSSNNIKLIAASSLLAIPLAYYILSNWLQQYAIRIELHWWLFLMPVIIILLLSWFTIAGKLIRSVLTNPVQELKTE